MWGRRPACPLCVPGSGGPGRGVDLSQLCRRVRTSRIGRGACGRLPATPTRERRAMEIWIGE
eukprot:7378115-Prymnesium_polylepis.1